MDMRSQKRYLSFVEIHFPEMGMRIGKCDVLNNKWEGSRSLERVQRIDDMDSSSCTCSASRKSKYSRKKTLVVRMKTWLLPLLFLTLCTYGKALGFVKKTDDEGPTQELEILHRMNIVNRNLHSKYRRKMRQEDIYDVLLCSHVS